MANTEETGCSQFIRRLVRRRSFRIFSLFFLVLILVLVWILGLHYIAVMDGDKQLPIFKRGYSVTHKNGKIEMLLVRKDFVAQFKRQGVRMNNQNTTVTKLPSSGRMAEKVRSPGQKNGGDQVAMDTKGRPTILILSLLHNSEKNLPTFNHLIDGLTYPKSLISVVFGEENSVDNTVNITNAMLNQMVKDYRRVGIHSLQVNSGFIANTAERHNRNYKHSLKIQYDRRRHLALARNILLSHGLKDEDWVLWLDSDIEWVPNDLIEHMLWAKKDILVPRCAIHGKTWESLYDMNTWRETEESRRWQSEERPNYLFLEGYNQPRPSRLYLDSLRNEGELVEVDGVGGCVLLVNSLLHRNGLNFPAFLYKNQIETEGFARMAQSMGYKLWALPRLTVYHSCSRETTWINCNE